MKVILDSLQDKNADFVEKVNNCFAVLADASMIFPGKNQFIFDWLLNSMLKIGKFDDTNIDSKKRVFMAKEVWKLYAELLKNGRLNNLSPILEVNSQQSLLRLNSSILVLLNLTGRLLKRFETENIAEIIVYLEQILDIISDSYFSHLGNNPTHFFGLLENLEGFSERIDAEIFDLMFKFTNGYDSPKKLKTGIMDVLLPRLSSCFEKYCENQSLNRNLNEMLLSNASGFEKSLEEYIKTGHLSLDQMSVYILEFLTKQDDSFSLKAATMKTLRDHYSPENPRKFLFSLFTAFSKNKFHASLLKILAESKAYQHRNDDIYAQQTKLLTEILTKSIELRDWSSIIQIMHLNYYSIMEKIDIILAMDTFDFEFVSSAFCLSVEARQLSSFVTKLLESNHSISWIADVRLPKLGKATMIELGSKLAELNLDTSRKCCIASALANNSPWSNCLEPFLRGLNHNEMGSEEAKKFVLLMLNKNPFMKFDSPGIPLIDSIVQGEALGSLTDRELVQLLPIIKSEPVCKRALTHIVQNGLFRLFKLGSFFETWCVREHLISVLSQMKDSIPPALICTIPVELFCLHPNDSLDLFDHFMKRLNEPFCLEALTSISRAFNVPISEDSLKIILVELKKLDTSSHSLPQIITSMTKRFGYKVVIDTVIQVPFSHSDFLRPLYSLQIIENLHPSSSDLSRLNSYILTASNPSETMIEAMASASIRLNIRGDIVQLENLVKSRIENVLLENISSKLLAINVRLAQTITEDLFAKCIAKDLIESDNEAIGKATIIALEKMPFSQFCGSVKTLCSSKNPNLFKLSSQYMIKCLNFTDQLEKVNLAAETCAWMLMRISDPNIAYRLTLSKSIRLLKPTEVSRILSICLDNLDHKLVFPILIALQQSYWHIIKLMIPAFIGLLIRLLEISVINGSQHQLELLARFLSDLSSVAGNSLAFSLPPLILYFLQFESKYTASAKVLRPSILGLLKHLDVDKSKAGGVEHIPRLFKICEHNADLRVFLKQLVDDYRHGHKYVGKA